MLPMKPVLYIKTPLFVAITNFDFIQVSKLTKNALYNRRHFSILLF